MFKHEILNHLVDNCYYGKIATDTDDLLVYEFISFKGNEIYNIVRYKEYDLEFVCTSTKMLDKSGEIRLLTRIDLNKTL
jgi:hypothetical protein